jgi:ferredoxin
MRATVDDSCISCGLCEDVCPEVFEATDGETAKVKVGEVPAEVEAAAREAAEACPLTAIHLEDGDGGEEELA